MNGELLVRSRGDFSTLAAGVALAAGVIAARPATRTEPTSVLRSE